MQEFIALTVAGIATYGCVYALTAMGLVVTYKTSGVFNFAQGAIGMLSAYFYWQLSQGWHLPSLLALLLTVLVFAPAIGAGLERTVVRRLETAGLEAKLTVTIALTILGMAVASAIWGDPNVVHTVPAFFAGQQIGVGGVNLTYEQVIVVIAAVASAVLLKVFFSYTRAGIATRAVVDDRELTSLTGATPARFSQLGWAMGCSLSALAGVLIAPSSGAALDVNNMTLAVFLGYGAVMMGRLKSLPMTFAGGIALGIVYSYAQGYFPFTEGWSDLGKITPEIFLVVMLLVIPQQKTILVRRVMARAPRIVGRRESLIGTGALLLAALVFSQILNGSLLEYADTGVAVAIILLSLVLLTGYGGQVSLCQMTFAGLGAWAMSEVGGSSGSLLGLLAAIGLAGGVGAVLARPSLRVRGLYLALVTFAFAEAMDDGFFQSLRFFGATGDVPVARPHIPGPTLHALGPISFSSDRATLIGMTFVFAVIAVGLLALRRSRYGRRMAAISDSPAACLTLGVDMVRSKLVVFTLSAAIAGLGGALFAGIPGQVGYNDFQNVVSLTLLLLAVVWGIRTIGGMLAAGVLYALQPLLAQHLSQPRSLFELLIGVAAIGVSQNPEGTFGGNTPLQKLRDRRASRADTPMIDFTQSDGRLTNVAG
jgi:branched-chain amino acid transport system permease protein